MLLSTRNPGRPSSRKCASLVCRLDGNLIVALNGRGIANEIDGVARVDLVGQRIGAKVRQGAVAPLLGEGDIHFLGPAIVLDCLLVLPNAHINVGWHMNHVTRNRNRGLECVGGHQRSLGLQ